MRATSARQETDFYLAVSQQNPLLSAAEEQACDRRKWAAARRCARLLLAEPDSRQTLTIIARACTVAPPVVEDFSPRSLYFGLRKDLVQFLPGGDKAKELKRWASRCAKGASPAQLIKLAENFGTAATLVAALTALRLRQCGKTAPDMVAKR